MCLLPQVIGFLLRDYVDEWYRRISPEPAFNQQCRSILQQALVAVSTRCKTVDWNQFFTTTLVDLFMAHLRLYRVANRLVVAESEGDGTESVRFPTARSLARPPRPQLFCAAPARRSDTDRAAPSPLGCGQPFARHFATTEQAGRRRTTNLLQGVEDKFFTLEKNKRKPICKDPARETAFLRDVSEVLLYLLLPQADFHSRVGRYLTREIVAATCLQPTMAMASDPDFVNQCFAVWIPNSSITYQSILDLIRTSTSTQELEVVMENVEAAVANKTQGAGLERDTPYKMLLEALLYAKGECRRRQVEITGEDEYLTVNVDESKVLSFKFVTSNNIALTYFQEFMNETQRE